MVNGFSPREEIFNGCLEQIMLFEIKLILYVAAMIAGFRHEEYIFFMVS